MSDVLFKILSESLILNEDDQLTDEEAAHINPTGADNTDKKQNENDLNSNEPITDNEEDLPEPENNNDNNDSGEDEEQDADDLNSNEPITDNEEDLPDGDNADSGEGYDEENTEEDSITSQIKKLEKELDKDLTVQDLTLRKSNLYETFENTIDSIDYIYKSMEFMFNRLDVRNEYDEHLKTILEVKNLVYTYLTELFPTKSYLESKYFISDVFVYLVELNKVLKGVQINKNK